MIKKAKFHITFDKLVLKSEIKQEIASTKKLMKNQMFDESQQLYLDGYLNGLRMALCMLEELGGDEVSA
jgi:hypothetical protein